MYMNECCAHGDAVHSITHVTRSENCRRCIYKTIRYRYTNCQRYWRRGIPLTTYQTRSSGMAGFYMNFKWQTIGDHSQTSAVGPRRNAQCACAALN